MKGWMLAVGTAGVLGAGALVAGAPGVVPPGEGGVLDGYCEASAILPWEGGFLVGDNETEDRLWRLGADLAPAGALPLSEEVEDIEALAVGPGGELVVVGSQSANKKGKARPDRERVLVQGHRAVRPDLSGCGPCQDARGLPPKEGGLSIEGAAWWEGAWWLGVRSPRVGESALLLRMEGDPAGALSVAETIGVDLGGFGIRDLVVDGDGLLVLAGPLDGRDAPHRLYRLAHAKARPERLDVTLPAGAEGLVRDGDDWLVVIDGDGKPGEDCATPARWQRVPREASSG